MDFVKMHGLGNDFVVLDLLNRESPADPARLAREVCDRHFAIGADGLALILPSERADARMRIFNPDGSEPEMCGNAVRCVAKYLFEAGRARGERVAVETGAGVKDMRVFVEGGRVARVSVDMGVPKETGHAEFLIAGARAEFMLVSMGNPHAVTYSLYPEDDAFYKYGPRIERNPVFPEGTNVEFCEVLDRGHIRVRVWERGAGETLACGTGACGVAAVAIDHGYVDRRVDIVLDGGRLTIEWDGLGRPVYMSGPAEYVCNGEFQHGI
jgi:diaminopimelate epimerase